MCSEIGTSVKKSETTVCDYSIEVLFKLLIWKIHVECVCVPLKRASFGIFGRITNIGRVTSVPRLLNMEVRYTRREVHMEGGAHGRTYT